MSFAWHSRMDGIQKEILNSYNLYTLNPFLCVCVLYCHIWCLSLFQLSSCFDITGDNAITSPSLVLYSVPPPSCRLSSYPLHQSLIHNLSDRLFFCRHNQSVWQCKQSLLLPVSLFLHQQETTINTDRKWERALTLKWHLGFSLSHTRSFAVSLSLPLFLTNKRLYNKVNLSGFVYFER